MLTFRLLQCLVVFYSIVLLLAPLGAHGAPSNDQQILQLSTSAPSPVWNILHAYNNTHTMTLDDIRLSVSKYNVNAIEVDILYHEDNFYATHDYWKCSKSLSVEDRAKHCLELVPILQEIERNEKIHLLWIDPKAQPAWAGNTLADLAVLIRQHVRTKAIWWGLVGNSDVAVLVSGAAGKQMPSNEGVSVDYGKSAKHIHSVDDLYLRAVKHGITNVGYSNNPGYAIESCNELNKALAYRAAGKLSRVLIWTVNPKTQLRQLYQVPTNTSYYEVFGCSSTRTTSEEQMIVGRMDGIISDMIDGVAAQNEVVLETSNSSLMYADSATKFWDFTNTPPNDEVGFQQLSTTDQATPLYLPSSIDNLLANPSAEMPPMFDTKQSTIASSRMNFSSCWKLVDPFNVSSEVYVNWRQPLNAEVDNNRFCGLVGSRANIGHNMFVVPSLHTVPRNPATSQFCAHSGSTLPNGDTATQPFRVWKMFQDVVVGGAYSNEINGDATSLYATLGASLMFQSPDQFSPSVPSRSLSDAIEKVHVGLEFISFSDAFFDFSPPVLSRVSRTLTVTPSTTTNSWSRVSVRGQQIPKLAYIVRIFVEVVERCSEFLETAATAATVTAASSCVPFYVAVDDLDFNLMEQHNIHVTPQPTPVPPTPIPPTPAPTSAPPQGGDGNDGTTPPTAPQNNHNIKHADDDTTSLEIMFIVIGVLLGLVFIVVGGLVAGFKIAKLVSSSSSVKDIEDETSSREERSSADVKNGERKLGAGSWKGTVKKDEDLVVEEVSPPPPPPPGGVV